MSTARAGEESPCWQRVLETGVAACLPPDSNGRPRALQLTPKHLSVYFVFSVVEILWEGHRKSPGRVNPCWEPRPQGDARE